MKIISKYKALGLWKKIALITAFCLILHGVTGFLILPAIVKSVSITQLTKILKRDVTIDRVRINPYEMCLTVEGFKLMEKNSSEPFFSFDSLLLNLGSISLVKLAPVIQKFHIDHPFFRLVRQEKNHYNISDLFPEPQPPASLNRSEPSIPQPDTSEPDTSEPDTSERNKTPANFFGFILANLGISNGKIEFLDTMNGTTHVLDHLNLELPFVSSMADYGQTFVKPRFSVFVDDAPVKLSADTKPFANSLETTLSLDLKNVDLSRYLAYVPVETTIKNVAGKADILLTLGFSKDKSNTPTLLLSGALNLKDFFVETIQGETILRLKQFGLQLNPSTPLTGKINIHHLTLESPLIHIVRNDQGILNLNNLVMEKKSGPAESAQPGFPLTIALDRATITNAAILTTDLFNPPINSSKGEPDPQELVTLFSLDLSQATIDTLEKSLVVERMAADRGVLTILRLDDNRLNIDILKSDSTPAQVSSDAEKPSWTVQVNQLAMGDFSIKGKGLARPGQGDILVDRLNLKVTDISTQPGKKASMDLDFKINTTGSLGIKGKIGLNPVTANLDMNMDDITLAWAQPFLVDHITPLISNGSMAASGTIEMENPGTPDFKAGFTGKAKIVNLSLTEPLEGNKLIAWKSLGFSGMEIDTSPLSPFHASIRKIALDQPFGRIVVDKDKRVNLQNILKNPGKNQEQEKNEKDNAPKGQINENIFLTIDEIVLNKGKIELTDRSIQPGFKMNLDQINTTLKNFDSRNAKKADFELSAKVNTHGNLKINGQITPLDENIFIDTQINLTGMELGSLSPYSGKYAGYTIQRGKLSMDLSYLIDNGNLDSKNDLYLDLFDFGEPTQSKDAINAPVRLAVALLKDTRGKIKLNLPVTGNLNDPEFSLGGIILKMIMNLLAKAATSPFALLGSMFGGGEDLNVIEFSPGSTIPTQDSLEKITILSRALQERPGLGLEITGHVDLDRDKKAVQDQRFKKSLKAVKLSEMIDRGEPGIPVDEIPLSDEEFNNYLEKAYLAANPAALSPTYEPQGNRQDAKPVDKNSSNAKTGDAKSKDSKPDIQPNKTEPEQTGPDFLQMEKSIRETIVVSDDDLLYLAHTRAISVADLVLSQGKIDTARIFMVEPKQLEPLEKEGLSSPASVLLQLR